eukprot:5610340-Amphidinium_carterae.1
MEPLAPHQGVSHGMCRNILSQAPGIERSGQEGTTCLVVGTSLRIEFLRDIGPRSLDSGCGYSFLRSCSGYLAVA